MSKLLNCNWCFIIALAICAALWGGVIWRVATYG